MARYQKDMKGLIIPEVHPDDFVFGSNKLGDNPVNPGGDWTYFIPQGESQAVNPFEPFCCVSEATNNALETLLRRKYGQLRNLSDRFLAAASGTGARNGNDPKTVGQTIKTKGCVLEDDYPFKAATWGEFYQIVPRNLYTLALSLISEEAIGYEWVNADPASMMAALDYSPLTAGVYAWAKDPITSYYVSKSQQEHDTLIFNYDKGVCWYALDSYEPYIKKLAWDFQFVAVMRYTIDRQVVNETAWRQFVRLIRNICGL